MRHALVTAALASLLGCAATALTAQGPVPDAPAIAPPAPPAVTPQRKLNLTVEQRYVIRENIKDVNREPVSAPARGRARRAEHPPAADAGRFAIGIWPAS